MERLLKSLQRQYQQIVEQQKDWGKSEAQTFRDFQNWTPELRDFLSWQQATKSLPVTNYENYPSEYIPAEENRVMGQRVESLILTSGTTTGSQKKIPQTQRSTSLLRRYFRDLLTISTQAYIQKHQNLEKLNQCSITLTSTASVKTDSEIPHLTASQFVQQNLPHTVDSQNVPSLETCRIIDPLLRAQKTLEELNGRSVSSISSLPAHGEKFLRCVLEITGKSTIREVWPDLRVFSSGAYSVAPFARRIDELMGHELIYVSNFFASEGPIGYPLVHPETHNLPLDNYHFFPGTLFSFKKGQEILTYDELKPGDIVELLLTTSNGFINYQLGDSIEIVTTEPTLQFRPRGRIGVAFNELGEKVEKSTVEKIVDSLEGKEHISHFFAFVQEDEKQAPHYHFVFCSDEHQSAKLFQKTWEKQLFSEFSKHSMYFSPLFHQSALSAPKVEVTDLKIIEQLFATYGDKAQYKPPKFFNRREDFQKYIQNANCSTSLLF